MDEYIRGVRTLIKNAIDNQEMQPLLEACSTKLPTLYVLPIPASQRIEEEEADVIKDRSTNRP